MRHPWLFRGIHPLGDTPSLPGSRLTSANSACRKPSSRRLHQPDQTGAERNEINIGRFFLMLTILSAVIPAFWEFLFHHHSFKAGRSSSMGSDAVFQIYQPGSRIHRQGRSRPGPISLSPSMLRSKGRIRGSCFWGKARKPPPYS